MTTVAEHTDALPDPLRAAGSARMAAVRLASVDDVDKDTFAGWLAQVS